MRNFGTHGGRPSLGGQALERPHTAQNTRADLIPLPANSIYPSRPPFKRGEITQAMFDVLAVSAAFLFVSVLGCGLAFACAILLFVRL